MEKDKKIYSSVLELIGNTPLLRLRKIVDVSMAEVLVKLEFFNPSGSLKDRICLLMLDEAERKGILKPGATVIEATTGNTGIALAMVCAVKGYKCIIVMPEHMNLERIYLLKAYGAEVLLTPKEEGMEGAIKKAGDLAKMIPRSFLPQQFLNPLNPKAHKETTAKEIWEATEGKIDAFVCPVGSGGTLTGIGEFLKERQKDIKVIAVEPEKSAVLSGGKPGFHKIHGIGMGFIPKILKIELIDEIIKVKEIEAFDMFKKIAKLEGLLVGISGGATISAALQVAKRLGKEKRVVAILPDTGERYFSVVQYFEF